MSGITKIVLTGGPCAGKTTALVKLIEHFSSLGFKVFTIPEVPTMFTQAGMDYLTTNREFFYEGEKATLEVQLALEDKFLRMAEACTEPCIIVCDRGTMDISAYMTKDMWEDITRAVGTSTAELRERYDAVLHLVSAADGAEQFYTTSNNASRNEPADEKGLQIARMLDKKVISAWAGHSHLRVINNHEDFEAKIKRVLREISNVLALPSQIEEERKYIVRLIGDIPECTTSEITQTYLVADPDSEVRLRKRVWNNGKPVYLLNSKKKVSEHEQIETEQQVNSNLYIAMMQQADPYRRTIEKTRRSFIWKGQFFELDTYKVPEGLMILETKGVTANEEVKIPPFLEAVEDITGRKEFYNYNLAKR